MYQCHIIGDIRVGEYPNIDALFGKLIDKIGIGGIIYLGLSGVPETTTELVVRFNDLYNLDMVEGDIVEQIIPGDAKCIAIKFEKLSLNFSGTFRVDLTTPIVEEG